MEKSKKFFKYAILGSVCTISGLQLLYPVSSVKANSVFGKTQISQNLKSEETLKFTNDDLYNSAKQLYENGQITKQDFLLIQSISFERFGIKGENKIVKRADGKIDIYINNVISNMLVGGAVAAAAAAIAAIPAVAAFLAAHGISAAALSGALGAGISTVTSTEKGLIITAGITKIGAGSNVHIYGIKEQ